VRRPELLEQRLVLSHAPVAGDDGGLALLTAIHTAAVPTFDAARTSGDARVANALEGNVPQGYASQNNASQNNAAQSNTLQDDASQYNAAQYGGLAAHNVDAALDVNAARDANAALDVNAALGDGSRDAQEFVLLEVQVVPEVQSSAAQSPAGAFDKAPSGDAAHAVSLPMALPDDYAPALIVDIRFGPGPVDIPHSLPAASADNSSAILAFGLPADSQAAMTHVSPTVVPTNPFAGQNSAAVGQGNNVQLAMPSDGLHRVVESERPSAAALLPQLDRPHVDREHLAAPSKPFAPARPAVAAAEGGDAAAEFAADRSASRDSLMAGIAVNFDVIDRALDSTLAEIEKMGGDIVAWLDEPESFAWASAVAAVVLVSGGSYYWQRRRADRRSKESLEEPSSWLFTHLCTSGAQP
jgi:hypothetical protein